jgi:hypothetical protein
MVRAVFREPGPQGNTLVWVLRDPSNWLASGKVGAIRRVQNYSMPESMKGAHARVCNKGARNGN